MTDGIGGTDFDDAIETINAVRALMKSILSRLPAAQRLTVLSSLSADAALDLGISRNMFLFGISTSYDLQKGDTDVRRDH